MLFGHGRRCWERARSPRRLPQRLLIFLSRIYGTQHGREVVIGLPLTHGDLANLIGGDTAVVTVQLARMQARGIIKYHRGLISIQNLPALDLEVV